MQLSDIQWKFVSDSMTNRFPLILEKTKITRTFNPTLDAGLIGIKSEKISFEWARERLNEIWMYWNQPQWNIDSENNKNGESI